MKKLLFSLFCAISVMAVNAQTVTIKGVLVTEPEPCVGEECVTTCLSLAISTAEKTYFIKGKCGESSIFTLIDGRYVTLKEGYKVVATGTVTTLVDNNGEEFYVIDIISISWPAKADWCTQWNVMEFVNYMNGDSKATTYIYVADGDTTIVDKTYTKISSYFSLTPENKQYVAAIRQQGDSVMVYYEDADYLLYDFGVERGDDRDIFVGINNWKAGIKGTFRNRVDDISRLPDGRKKITVSIVWDEPYDEYYGSGIEYGEWIEGVGSTDGLLYTGADAGRVGGSSYALLCASDADGYKFDNNSGWLNDLGCVENYDIKADEDTLVQTTHVGHEYVDLSLPSGTLWATCNVGATNIEDYGDYYAWGETTIKETYDWETYKYCNGDYTSMTKYCNNSTYGIIDSLTTLVISDDAANANWGGNWRMPTVGEIYELFDACIWKWKIFKGVRGYYITSKKDATKFLFLPAAGFREIGLDNSGAEVSGHYWSVSIDSNYPSTARRMYFHSDYYDAYNSDRRFGFSVRPVVSKESLTAVENIEQTNFDNTRKVIENGQVVIIRDGVRYNVLGVRL